MFFKRKNYFNHVEVVDPSRSTIRILKESEAENNSILWWLLQWWKTRGTKKAELAKTIVQAKLWLAMLAVLRVLAIVLAVPLTIAVLVFGIAIVLAMVVLILLAVAVKTVFGWMRQR